VNPREKQAAQTTMRVCEQDGEDRRLEFVFMRNAAAITPRI